MPMLKTLAVLLLPALLLLNSGISTAHGNKKHPIKTGLWAVPAGMSKRPNPLADSPVAITAGKALFTLYCSSCHGMDAKGNDASMRVDLSRSAMHSTAGELAYKIAQGRSEMPNWAQVLTETKIWELVAYLKAITPTTASKPRSSTLPSIPKQESSSQ